MTASVTLTTPLGPDVLQFESMYATEALGRMASYSIVALSKSADIDPYKLLGQQVALHLKLPSGGERHFNAHVCGFRQLGFSSYFTRYEITAHPWLWFLTRCNDCRIFQNKKIPDIIQEVFGKYPNASFDMRISGEYEVQTYCVQYRESDFEFVSRLMEQEGIHYYFTHTKDAHILVVADSVTHSPFPAYESLRYLPADAGEQELERVSDWAFAYEVKSGAFVLDDYDYTKPRVELKQQSMESRPHAEASHEVFDYPGQYDTPAKGENYARIRMEEVQSRHLTFKGSTNAWGVAAGCEMSLKDHPREDQNRKYLITSTRIHLGAIADSMGSDEAPTFEAEITCIDSQVQYRPLRVTPKPIVQGPQTAQVVGPAGEEIYTDDQARVKVQFHWDRYGKQDENSSCWLRVSYPIAGKGWGEVKIPRIGQEVVVNFLEGDPDRPLITGRVYNAVQTPPYAAPGMVSGMKSQTHKGQGFNAMSMDDTAGKEKIDIHAQHDMTTTVLHDQTDSIKNNRQTTVDVDDTLTVTGNRNLTVKGKVTDTIDTGQEVTVKSGRTETVSGGAISTVNDGFTGTVNGSYKKTVNGDVDKTITSGEKKRVTGGRTLTVTSGGYKEEVTGEHNTRVTGPADHSVTNTLKQHANAPATYTSNTLLTLGVGDSMVEVHPGSVVIVGGGSTITVDASGVSVNGSKISLNC
jgi:type VI secretion system secreted protein VgrG